MESLRKEVAVTNLRIVEATVEIIKWNMGAIFMAAGLVVAIMKLMG